MATRQARRAANKEGSIYSVKTGFKQIFTDARLAAITLQAYKLVKSWAKFVCRAATEGLNNIWDLLPRYTSLAQPPAATMDYLDYLVATFQSLIGSLPVTDRFLQRQPESYLPWLHMVLLDFHDVQDAPHAPKLFTTLPQSSNHTQFITISSTSLHK
ncbi:TPA: hypothetical protein ACH3X1_004743 [Trebouxia sp. C0004]